jgi:hypothetical protein
VKKLLIFLIMLVVGVALFAMPVIGEPDTISLNTVEAVPQFAGVFATVTDVSPAIALAENFDIFINSFEVSVTNDYLFNGNQLYRQEVNPIFGCSKTVVNKVNSYTRLAPDRRV